MDKRKFLQATVAGSMLLSLPSVHAQTTKKAPAQKMTLTGREDAMGKIIGLDSFAGAICMVTFFSAGCALCNHDLKLMREFYVANKQKNFALLGVNMDALKKDFEDYRKLINLTIPKEQNFPMVWKNGPEYADNFGTITKMPTHFILDKGQNLLFKREGKFMPDDWDTLYSYLT